MVVNGIEYLTLHASRTTPCVARVKRDIIRETQSQTLPLHIFSKITAMYTIPALRVMTFLDQVAILVIVIGILPIQIIQVVPMQNQTEDIVKIVFLSVHRSQISKVTPLDGWIPLVVTLFGIYGLCAKNNDFVVI